MGIVKTIGGDRLGAGKKMKGELRNYERSTHNLSELFQTSIAPGVLYPVYVNQMLNADVFEFDIRSDGRTLPTIGPMFGAFKMQLDFFFVPIRLYNARLHNNPIKVGMQMQNIKLPVVDFPVLSKLPNESAKDYIERTKCDSHSLPYYLGFSGFGWNDNKSAEQDYSLVNRNLPAIGFLAYYDIFKNYYANKQEDNFYFINNELVPNLGNTSFTNVYYYNNEGQSAFWDTDFWNLLDYTNWLRFEQDSRDFLHAQKFVLLVDRKKLKGSLVLDYINEKLKVKLPDGSVHLVKDIIKSQSLATGFIFEYFRPLTDNDIIELLNIDAVNYAPIEFQFNATQQNYLPVGFYYIFDVVEEINNILLGSQSLESIDDLRDAILMTSKSSIFNLTDYAEDSNFELFMQLYSTYSTQKVAEYNGVPTKLGYNLPMQGLICKTYQNDIFNTWLSKEFIEGVDSIAEVTKIDTSNGLYMDALNLAEKVYNMKCQIAISGGTWEDWQEATYGVRAIRRAETPIYCGGQSAVISFDEVVSNSATDILGDPAPLGTLGGRGKLSNHQGGKVVIKAREPGIVMAILSLTPLDPVYVQGNKWFNTDLFSPDDYHKPALDAIGFQDLIGEQMSWTDTYFDEGSWHRRSYGKLPAWMNYMTSVGRAAGDFADDSGKSFMVLSRTYDINSDGSIADFTAYIDPKKFNYMFAYADRDAQNFWIQVYFDVKARRKMSAKLIPNI